jgi:gluconate 2-dehydrogenase alpha chain
MIGAARQGITVFPYPCAINSQPYDGRPACVECGFCSGYGCPSNAKGAPAVTVLRKGLLSGNLLLLAETRAIQLLVAGNQITGVVALDPDGQRVTYAADRYVLAASPIEDARLCLLSNVPDASGMLGRNLTFHYQTIAIGVFDERLHGHRGKTVSHAFTDFRGKPGDPEHPLGGIVEVGGPSLPIEGMLNAVQGVDVGRTLKLLLRQGALRDRILSLTMHGEDAPQPTNRVDLDPAVRDLDGLPVARITYANHAFETSARTFYGPKMLDLLQACGAGWVLVAPADGRRSMSWARSGSAPMPRPACAIPTAASTALATSTRPTAASSPPRLATTRSSPSPPWPAGSPVRCCSRARPSARSCEL